MLSAIETISSASSSFSISILRHLLRLGVLDHAKSFPLLLMRYSLCKRSNSRNVVPLNCVREERLPIMPPVLCQMVVSLFPFPAPFAPRYGSFHRANIDGTRSPRAVRFHPVLSSLSPCPPGCFLFEFPTVHAVLGSRPGATLRDVVGSGAPDRVGSPVDQG